jgi:hypothetical protein
MRARRESLSQRGRLAAARRTAFPKSMMLKHRRKVMAEISLAIIFFVLGVLVGQNSNDSDSGSGSRFAAYGSSGRSRRAAA